MGLGRSLLCKSISQQIPEIPSIWGGFEEIWGKGEGGGALSHIDTEGEERKKKVGRTQC